ncbi:MAG TPA: TonB-dependent receptor, partial [Steroidobacteraceae bacterium]|nr:TonB-dependent receptor [Steroidobacteraceae bacterium]
VVNGLTTGAALGLDWRINDALRASLGVRADSTRYDYDNRMLAGNTDENSIPCNGGCLFARPADRADRFTNVSPKFDLHYRLSTRSALYLLANRGFRPPEMTELYRLQRQQRIASLASEQLDSAEFGVKHERPLLSARLAVYDMRKRNAILRDANGFNVSDGATSHRGVEYEWRWLPSESITLSGAGSWARHRYEFSRAIEAGETIVAGNDVDSAPRQLHSIALAWRPSEHVRLALDARYLGRYFLDAANTATYPGHTVMNGAIAWQLDADWRLNLRIENLLDRVYADRADFAFGDYRYFPARRRAAYLSIDFATP